MNLVVVIASLIAIVFAIWWASHKLKDTKEGDLMRIVISIGVTSLCAVGFMLFGLLIDISIILRYDFTPISFTRIFLFLGVVVGLFQAFVIARHWNRRVAEW